MAKITLTIDPGYCADWEYWHGVREIVQNAKDADEFDGFKMEVEHFPRTSKLVVSSEGVTIDPASLLLLGRSSKRGSGQRGQFGEGFVLGCLALVRAGHAVTIYNGDEVWRPEITEAEDGPFAGQPLLSFNTRKLQQARRKFSVEVENVSKEVWEATRKLFLFLCPPKRADVVTIDGEGSVLLNPEHVGMIFARGIFVNRVNHLACGYDLPRLSLDRDRRVIDEWQLGWTLGGLWTSAHAEDPGKCAARIYDMVKEDKGEVKNLDSRADQKLLKALRAEFHKEHGDDMVPVRDMLESRELTALGAASVVVNRALLGLLEKAGLGVNDVKKKLQGAVTRRLAWGELSPGEQDACSTWVERVTKAYAIVTFNDPTVACRYLAEEGKVCLAQTALADSARNLVSVVATQEAMRRGTELHEVLLDAMFPGQ